MPITPDQAVLYGRIGAHVAHARHGGKQMTAAARKGFLARFEREVDPDGTLPPEERTRRAEHALRAHMARLAAKSAAKRSRRL